MDHNTQPSFLRFRGLSSAKENPLEVDLVRLGQWVVSLSGKDQELLRHTREFRDFIDATCRLKQAQQQSIQTWNATNDTSKAKNRSMNTNTSFLQYTVSDEAVLGIMDYLESFSLVRIATTCTRLRDLAYRNARNRCKDIERDRQLSDVMHLLRAKEQIEGFGSASNSNGSAVTLPSVRIPTLLLRRRVLVSGAGDVEFNGIYFCTGCNGNGFLFTKPRYPFQRIPERERNLDPDGDIGHGFPSLNCMFARRFSGQDLLWYLSKSVYQDTDGDEALCGKSIVEVFSYWAPLPTTTSTAPHLFSYPNQSSTLRDQQTWQAVATNSHLEPPIVQIVE